MSTGDLVTLLATGAGAATTDATSRRFAIAMTCGTVVAMLLMIFLLGVRPDLREAIFLPKFWIKVAFVGCVAAATLLLSIRLSLPGFPLGRAPVGLAIPVFAIWAVAATALFNGDPAQRAQMFFGDTWVVCPFLIAMLSVPIFAGVIWAMRGLAPTRLRLAGGIAGLLAGATGALIYCLHCPEMEAPFVGFWYLLGMLIPAGIGALSGRRLLRW